MDDKVLLVHLAQLQGAADDLLIMSKKLEDEYLSSALDFHLSFVCKIIARLRDHILGTDSFDGKGEKLFLDLEFPPDQIIAP